MKCQWNLTRYSSRMSKPLCLQGHKLCPLIQIWNLLLSPSHLLQAESYFAIKWQLGKHDCNAYLTISCLESHWGFVVELVAAEVTFCCLMKEARILVNRDSRHLNNHELLSTTCTLVNLLYLGKFPGTESSWNRKACMYAGEILWERMAPC